MQSPDVAAYVVVGQVVRGGEEGGGLPSLQQVAQVPADEGSENDHPHIPADSHSEHAPWMPQAGVDDSQVESIHGEYVVLGGS